MSIDFDFFQIVDKNTILEYPDGHDNSTELSKFVWSSYYANPYFEPKIKNVKPDIEKINQLINILNNCNPYIPILVTNSHVHIYNFIHNIMDETNSTKLNLTNIDMHHDMFNNNTELDCGNWISHIKNDYDTNLTWIANPISREVYGLSDDKFNCIETTFDTINPKKIDGVFLCRSDTWLPPHLDKDFNTVFQIMCNHFMDVKGEQSITHERDMKELINQLKPVYKNISNNIKEK